MNTKKTIKTLEEFYLPGILNSYSIIFFLDNRLFAVVLLLSTFFNFYAGLSGLLAVILTLVVGKFMHLDENALRKGIYTFNALLTGIGMGTFFDPGFVFYSLLVLVTIFCLFISTSLGAWLNKYNLPHLSIPFVISFWFLILPSAHFENLGLTQRNIYWMNEMYALGGTDLIHVFQSIDSYPINKMLDIYLRSLSSVIFQNNIISGILIAIALLLSSRILFSLSLVGFFAAYLFAQFTGSEAASLTYYNIGANYMMVAFAIGGFFIIPSKHSYIWTIFLVPLTSLILLFFYKLLGYIQLPVFSLPFSLVVIMFLHFLQQRTKPNGLVLTPYQHYSPEVNLYTFRNNSERFSRFIYKTLQLPFWGNWTVTQGYDGEYTHLGEWSEALDFMVKDNSGLTYRGNGYACEDYYCFNKAIIAVADGIVESVNDNIEDNVPGIINTENNWGNTIVINHYNGVYSQLSHLKKGSIKVKQGDVVKSGDVIGLCGNSGRSPQPHLHFQIQSQPFAGAKTKYYPLAYYYKSANNKEELHQFDIPQKNDVVSNVFANKLLVDAFNILPENSFRFSYKNPKGIDLIEEWNACTDAYNNKYLYCHATGDTAYYICDGQMFYFTTYYGKKTSLLYYFFLSAYKTLLSTEEQIIISDHLPLNYINKNKHLVWLNDFISPFKSLLSVRFHIKATIPDDKFENDIVLLNSEINVVTRWKTAKIVQSTISVNPYGISKITFKSSKINIQATCIK